MSKCTLTILSRDLGYGLGFRVIHHYDGTGNDYPLFYCNRCSQLDCTNIEQKTGRISQAVCTTRGKNEKVSRLCEEY